MIKNTIIFGIAVLFIFFSRGPSFGGETALVKWVSDGDTILLKDGRYVRYIGINSPEIARKDKPGEPFSKEAKKLNMKLTRGKRVRLEFDKERRDRYGRILAYVYLSDGTFVNGRLVEKGLAYSLPKAPNNKYEQRFLKLQRSAMDQKKGIWKFFRNDNGPFIGNKKSKRFHKKGCPFGEKIGKKNRTLLDSSWKAFWAGFAPCSKCLK